MIDMMVQLMSMIDVLESKFCSGCDTEQATNGEIEGFWWHLVRVRLRRLAPVRFEHAGVV
jgi:hypothetical protein